MSRIRLSWWLYLVGSLLVFGSWVNLVPTGVGWIGWLAALAGWAIGSAERRKPRQLSSQPQRAALSPADEIAKLELLRKEGVISDDDFAEGKARILRSE